MPESPVNSVLVDVSSPAVEKVVFELALVDIILALPANSLQVTNPVNLAKA